MFINFSKSKLKRNLACLLQYPFTLKNTLCWAMYCLRSTFSLRWPEPIAEDATCPRACSSLGYLLLQQTLKTVALWCSLSQGIVYISESRLILLIILPEAYNGSRTIVLFFFFLFFSHIDYLPGEQLGRMSFWAVIQAPRWIRVIHLQ